MTDYVVFDIDGTVACVSHRRHHVADGNRDWDSFFAAMGEDSPIIPVVELNRMIAGLDTDDSPDVVLCSARPDDYREVTEAWLAEHGVCYDRLMLRPSGDTRSDVTVKREMLAALRTLYEGSDPLFVVDDRQCVVDMWRAEGIVCLQAAPGDFDRPRFEPGKLVLAVGPTHAGKSTLVDMAIAKGHLQRDDVVSSDSIREQLCGDPNDMSRNRQVFAAFHAIIKARVENGLDTFVDATNIRRRDRLAVVDCAPTNARVSYFVLDRPLPEKLDSLRPDFPEEVVRKQDHTFRSQLRDILAGDGRENVRVHDLRKAPR